MPKERKPHLFKAKQEIIGLIDERIGSMKADCITRELFDPNGDKLLDERREIAIWIKERNRLAKAIDMAEIELISKTNQGTLIWDGEK